MAKILRLTETDLTRLVKKVIKEQSNTKDGIVYSVQKTPTGKFKIFVTTPTVKTPTDAFTVFKGGSMWKEYNTQDEAQSAITSIVNNDVKSKKPQVGFRPNQGRRVEEQMDVSSDSEYYQERKREVSIPFDDLSMLSSLASRFCEDKDNFPDCRQVRRIISRHSLFM
jgi:hypothetical protein